MRIFHAPKVILVSRPSLVPEGIAELLMQYGESPIHGWKRDPPDGDGDGLAELMGRLCYGSFGGRQGRVGAMAYHANILEAGHGSVMEHPAWSFVVCGASRGYTHQQVRHRAGWAYSQESQHFIQYGAESGAGQEAGLCLTGIPPAEQEAFARAAAAAIEAYARLWRGLRDSFPKDAKVKKLVSGAARGLLPTALESRIGISANARALRHFCELRGQADNVLEVRLVAAQVAGIMRLEAPAMFQDMAVVAADDGHPSITSAYRKV